MKIGIIGLGRMGANIARRLMRGGHDVVGWDHGQPAIDAVAKDGMIPAADLADMRAKLDTPAIYWVMLLFFDTSKK